MQGSGRRAPQECTPDGSSLIAQAAEHCVAESGIRQQGRHHPVAVMGDPGLLQELPDIAALLPQAGDDGEQSAAADRTLTGLDALVCRPGDLRAKSLEFLQD
ncbi:MAG: hypothetical protein ACO3B3_08545, partial [Cyanobium sp.]